MPALTARIVCGAANNQLAHPGVEKDLADRGILYAPDYVVNAGGVIQVADELHGFDFDRCKAKAAKIFDTTLDIFARAKEDGVRPRRPTGSPSSGWRKRAAADNGAFHSVAFRVCPDACRDPPRGHFENSSLPSAGRPPRRG